MIGGINAAAWSDNTDVKLVIWCDITTKIYVGFSAGVPAASMCNLRVLERVTAPSRRRPNKSLNTRKERMIEVFLCIIFPLVFVALHYIVEGHRFDIYEVVGCRATYVLNWYALVLIWITPLLLALLSCTYAGLILRNLIWNRVTLSACLNNSASSIGLSRYIRLLLLSSITVVYEAAFDVYLIVYNLKINGVSPITSWHDVQLEFSRIARYSRFLLPNAVLVPLMMTWWIPTSACLLFLFCFVLGDEAIKDYRSLISWIKVKILRRPLLRKVEGTSSFARTDSALTDDCEDEKSLSLSRKDSNIIYIDIQPLKPALLPISRFDAHLFTSR
ncbi:hypothetical protein M422DRAFT_40025 [Sphaerobolus stellatus SS14]|uniref:Unplaced genomic scaffold SPHSTscaffold_1036, whole genome shotgun sequence n=1 Tax=Sphaerobolus stellatus (strain SS14) TaxID=990650 RepID=A0A0C9UBS1_SPHS4|nr:hypothetical protein M422DRAFT_40025 [Sphaerobolus stellatus SS14]